MAMRLYKTPEGPVLEDEGRYFTLAETNFDQILRHSDLAYFLKRAERKPTTKPENLLAPIGNQEVWAAGVTYRRSRDARKEEAAEAGGGDFYDRVYMAQRPELFPKAVGSRVVGPGKPVAIRRDSGWNVPEPELTLLITPDGRISGYTIGNDMSSRSIEGENPLYLPQAKYYDRSCALGPAIVITDEPMSLDTSIDLVVWREGSVVFKGSTALSEMKRHPADLADWLFRGLSFPIGVFLMTGTGIVPTPDFTLHPGDMIRITIEGLGELANPVG